MADLAGTAEDARKPIERTLSELTEAAVALIEGVDCAGVLLIKDGEFSSLAGTSDVARALDTHSGIPVRGPVSTRRSAMSSCVATICAKTVAGRASVRSRYRPACSA